MPSLVVPPFFFFFRFALNFVIVVLTSDPLIKMWQWCETKVFKNQLFNECNAFGLMPCPSAMAAYFSGLSSGTPMTAYIVIGLFAAGIATSLTLAGMIVQVFGNRFTKNSADTANWLSRLPWNYIRAVSYTHLTLPTILLV